MVTKLLLCWLVIDQIGAIMLGITEKHRNKLAFRKAIYGCVILSAALLALAEQFRVF